MGIITHGMKNTFAWLFFVLICTFFVLIGMVHSVLAIGLTFLFVLLFLIVANSLTRPIDKLSAHKFNVLFFALLCVALVFSIYLAFKMRIHLPGDTDIIFASVADILKDGKLNEINPSISGVHYPGVGLYTNNDYFCRFPNNIGLLLIYVSIYALGGKAGIPENTSQGQLPAIVATAIAVSLTVLFIALCVKIVYKRNSYALITLLLCYVFLPFVFGIPNFYTDLWVLPFTLGGVYCYLKNKLSKSDKKYLSFLAGFLIALGVQMKITAAVALVAIVIDLFLSNTKGKWKSLTLLLFGFISFTAIFIFWYRYSGFIDFSRSDEIGAPWNLWLLFGSHDVGGGTEIYPDTIFAASFPTMQERSAAIWQRVFENYRSYSFFEFLTFLRNKMLFAWNNGMFESNLYLLWPVESNWTAYLTQPQFLPSQIISAFSNIYMLFLYASSALSAGVSIVKKKLDYTFLSNLFIFGIMLYLQLFENAPRRAIIAIPFMIFNVIFLLSQWNGSKMANKFYEFFGALKKAGKRTEKVQEKTV